MKILVPALVAALFCTVVGCNGDTTVNTDDRSVTTPDTTRDPMQSPRSGSTPDRTTPRGTGELPAGVEETPANELPNTGADDEQI